MQTRMMTLALASACGLALCGVARADEVYSWANTSGTSVLPVAVTLDVTDAAVESGSFSLSGGTAPQFYTGDLAGFVSFAATGLQTSTPTAAYPFNAFNLAFAFDAAGDITSDQVTWYGPSEGGKIGGDMALSAGTFSSDDPRCGPQGLCGTLSGSWMRTGDPLPAPVPEPATFALLGAGLIGLVACRVRRTVI